MSNGGGPPNFAQQLWDIVTASNPYDQNMTLMAGQGIQLDDYEPVYWYFRNGQLRVNRAVRVPYCYPHPKNNQIVIVENLLIGYEGSGGI